MELDDKDKVLLQMLQKNSRESLTKLAKKLDLSIDSTHKRIKRLQRTGIIDRFGVFINPKPMGYELIVNIQIKLRNISDEELDKLMGFLKSHKNITVLITTLGHFDILCIMIAKNTEELETISRHIRQKFRDLIDDWKSVINLKVHKLEWYSF